MSSLKYAVVRVWMTQTLDIHTETYGPFRSEASATRALRRLRPTTTDALRVQRLFTLPPEETA